MKPPIQNYCYGARNANGFFEQIKQNLRWLVKS